MMRLSYKYIPLSPSAISLALMLTIVFMQPANAQYTKDRNPWPVIVNGVTVSLPFWGGINNAKPALIDFDGDGLLDLMIGEDRGKVAYFKNTGSAASPLWTPQVERLGGINTGSWFAFADIDADNDPDFFCDNRAGGAAFYRNNSIGDEIILTLEDPAFAGFSTGFNNTPAFADIDGDGDFDFFVGNQVGGVILYRNRGDEFDAFFEFETNFYDSVLAFPQGPLPPSDQAPQHGFSALSFADLDNDGDLDLFYGDSFNSSIWYFANFGDLIFSQLRFVSQAYFPISNAGFNHATFGDIDNDGSLEIIVGPANSGKIDNLILMKNTTFPDSVTLVVQDLNIIKDVDIGSNAMPAFGDLDGDGDQDLLLGGENGRLAYFKNTGSPTNPVFMLVTDFFDSIFVGVGAAPELIDWDSDGDLDLLLGTNAGKIEFWRNIGSPTNFTLIKVSELADQVKVIRIDQLAVPRAIDFNNDGKLDLILGEWDFNGFANVLLYENIGSPFSPSLQLVTRRLLERVFRPFTIPLIYDWDGDGRNDLIVGLNGIGLTLYRNIAASGTFPDSLTLIEQPALLPGSDDGAWLAMRLVDIDSDGDMDIFLGEQDGGLNFYRHDAVTFVRGDIDGLSGVNQADVMFLINFMILNGPAPQPSAIAADVNCSGSIDLADVIYLIGFLFNSGAAPCSN